MGVGSREWQWRQQANASPQMNITPLVDVVLVLLIIFMVVTPLLTKQLWLNVPPKVEEEAAASAAGCVCRRWCSRSIVSGVTKVNGEVDRRVS